ncbi:MAG TPA: hypothetical protein VEI83_13960 [Acidimicrobiales bacterium]|nr:hypothetical protein [Acidimicrobiales bacterium]
MIGFPPPLGGRPTPKSDEPKAHEKKRRKLAFSALALLLLASAATIGSWSAWSVTDSNSNNSFSTNTILIDDNQGGEGGSATATGTAMFNVTNLSPGSTSTTACIGVDFSGSATVSTLTLAASLSGAGQATLQNQLTVNTAQYNTSGTVTVTPGTNTNSGSCANYPSGGTNTTIGTQGATLAGWSGAGPYSIASPVTNTWYKFTISGLPAGDTNCATYCSQTITVTLTWTLTAS